MPRTNRVSRPKFGRSWKARQLMADLETELGRSLDPLEAMMRLYASEDCPLDIRYDAIKFVLPFVYPRLAALQVSSSGQDSPFNVDAVKAQMHSDPELRKAAERLALAAAKQTRADAAVSAEPEIVEMSPRRLAELKLDFAGERNRTVETTAEDAE